MFKFKKKKVLLEERISISSVVQSPLTCTDCSTVLHGLQLFCSVLFWCMRFFFDQTRAQSNRTTTNWLLQYNNIVYILAFWRCAGDRVKLLCTDGGNLFVNFVNSTSDNWTTQENRPAHSYTYRIYIYMYMEYVLYIFKSRARTMCLCWLREMRGEMRYDMI